MAHALLSASSSYRWLNCTPAPRLELQFPDRAGDAAKEGTVAHRLAEIQLRRFFHLMDEAEYKKAYEEIKASEFYSEDMESAVDVYCGIVTEKKIDAGASGVIKLEVRLSFTDWVPEGFGSADAVVISENGIEVIDFKYGKNVHVSAVGNTQMRLYALGAYQEYGFAYDFKTITMTIVQPRNGGVSSDSMTVDELLEWGDSIKPIAEKAFKGEGDTAPGIWCKFCKAQVACKTLAKYQLELEKDLFSDADLLTHEEIGEVLGRAEKLLTWVNKVKEYAYLEAVDGRPVKGYKLVEGKSVRRYKDESDVRARLVQCGLTHEDIFQPPKLLTLTAMEKKLGKKKFEEYLGSYIEKPPGQPMLVPESDKRPAITAGDMFEDLGGS